MPLVNYYQPWLLPFLTMRANYWPSNIKSYYYHSFEDGLWDVIDNKFPKGKQLTVLVPDFYCKDVVDNILIRGHRVVYYPLDRNFQISNDKFTEFVKTYRPDIVIIFNACGITSNLMKKTGWIK